MSRLPLHTLPAFRAAARLANLRAAADTLHLTHSAVSQQIRTLERQLGFALFERHGRRVVLNAAGKVLLASVEGALAALEDGLQQAAAAATGSRHLLRVTALPSFAQRWLLPRMSRWRERHPDIALEIDASQQLVDLVRAGFHAGVRAGRPPWPGLEAEPLLDSPLIVVASPAVARRLLGQDAAAFANEPLIGDAPTWQHWFAAAGLKLKVRPVADFNDAGLMLQAAEHGLGLTLARDVLAADALADGRLVRLSPIAIDVPQSRGYYLVYPPALRQWPPLAALRRWLLDELDRAKAQRAAPARRPARHPTAPAGRTGVKRGSRRTR